MKFIPSDVFVMFFIFDPCKVLVKLNALPNWGTAIFLILVFPCYAQNLVPNPSFERNDETGMPCNFITDIDRFASTLGGEWTLPNGGTTDVYSTMNAKECWTHMPDSEYPQTERIPPIGTQNPRTGNQFVGIITHNGFSRVAYLPSYREYVQVKLKEPLVSGEKYCAEVFVSLAERPRYATGNMGICFNDYYIDRRDERGEGDCLPLTPQIVQPAIITDTINWVRVSGIYQATAPFEYLIIGNFNFDHLTPSLDMGGPPFPSLQNFNIGYYYLDDVRVEIIKERKFSFTGDSIICKGEQAVVLASGDLADITWTTLQDTSTIIGYGENFHIVPNQTTAYRVKGRNCNTFVQDTVTIYVNSLPVPSLGNDITICLGTSVTLTPGYSFSGYLWYDKSNAPEVVVNEAGIYWVEVQNEFGCVNQDTVKVQIKDVPHLNLGVNSLLCRDYFTLKAGFATDVSYQWSTGSQDSVMLPKEGGEYWVTATNQCGTVKDTIRVFSMQDIYIPNVVTMNRDNKNERLQIQNLGGLEHDVKLQVFNRWGNEVYQNKNYQGEWPLSETISSGIYYYTMQIGRCRPVKGMVHVITGN